jgi:hypothetical protein
MEEIIYQGVAQKLNEAGSYLQDHNQPPVAHVDWWRNQVEEALAATPEGNTGIAWPRPAVFVEFSPMQVEGNAVNRKGTGEVTLHVVQDAVGQGSEAGSGVQDDFVRQLQYLGKLLDWLDGELVGECGARLNHTGQVRDHSNRPLMHERLTLRYTVRLQRSTP